MSCDDRLKRSRYCYAALALAWILVPHPTAAAPRSAHVAWTPSPTAGIGGYLIYVREADGASGPPLDVPGNALSHTVTGLEDTRDYVFSVAAYMPDGTESRPSNEVRLPAGEGGSTCEEQLEVRRLLLRRTGDLLKVSGSAAFQSAIDADPSTTDVVLDLRGPDGELLYRTVVPGSALRANRSATRFRYVRARVQDGRAAEMPRRLVFRRNGDQLAVSFEASIAAPLAETAAARVVLEVSVGLTCARDDALICEGGTDMFDCVAPAE